MKKCIQIVVVFFLTFQIFAQEQTVQVIDKQTETPISFVKINDGTTTLLSDIDGKATLKIDPRRTYSFRFFNYKDTSIVGANLIKQPKVYLLPDAQIYGEVVVRPGENPAHRIIQHVMDHKKENDPLQNNAFRYDSYSKLYFTGEIKEGILRDTISDTSMLNLLELLDRQYLFLVETKAERSFKPPSYDKEVVTAYNVSGVKMPIFATIVNQFQSFSFYDNNFELNQKEYINPIAPGSLRRYLFILEDTLVNQNNRDTTFTISYRPRKGKNFEGLEGYLYINTNNWAIERVIAKPYETSSFYNVKIIQEYAFVENKKWFPKKISTELDFNPEFFGVTSDEMEKSAMQNLIGRSSLYINEIHFDPAELKKVRGFNPVAVEVKENALADSSLLKQSRQDNQLGKEDATYIMIDSLAKDANFDKYVEWLKIASTGVLPMGSVGLQLNRLVGYNDQEGFRLGLGLETNERISKVTKLGGYFAYGLRDKEWKWGGDLSFKLYSKKQIQLNLHYSDDLHERGGTDFYSDAFNIVSRDIFRELFINVLDKERHAGISLSGLIRQNMKVQFFGNYKRFTFIDNYRYYPLFSNNGTIDKFDIAEAGIVWNWNIRERVMILGDQRISLGTKWPKITLKAVKGISGIFNAQYDYYRFNLTVSQDFKIRGFGSINLTSRNGMTLGNVPITLTQIQEGTGRQYRLSVPNTFETMLPAEFFSDRSSSLFFHFTFLPIKNKTTWIEPLFGIHSAVGYGDMYNRTDHKNFNFKVPTKGFYESGLIIDNLIKSGFAGIGVSAFYRYGAYQFDQVKDNFFYKLSLKINI